MTVKQSQQIDAIREVYNTTTDANIVRELIPVLMCNCLHPTEYLPDYERDEPPTFEDRLESALKICKLPTT